ncbi:MAG: orotate phosphoribosyltransferase [Bacteroidetes bacterium SW_9_63_38]|nr:MAG: orotate phosphoribosyltransferase [Bacteroidetes bacterium SW_9_63_38]
MDSPSSSGPSFDASVSAASESAGARRAHTTARALLEIEAVKLRPNDPFTWSSGMVAPIYCDNRLTISHPGVRRAIRDGFRSIVSEQSLLPATVAGTATAGIPHAAWLAEATDQPMVYVRSSAKEHGTGARIEGHLDRETDVIVLEDLISTGGSALDAVEAVRNAGASVTAVLAIFSYELEAAAAAFDEADVPRRVLTDFSTLVEVAHGESRVSTADLEGLHTWREDPAAWSREHGGEAPDRA